MIRLPLLLLLLPGLASGATAGSPWWEGYTSKDTFLCRDRGRLVLERNEAQAALTSGGQRLTLFRQGPEQPGLVFASEGLRVILRDDELTVEQGARQLRCLRMEQV
jgi:hypothetical protein